MRSRPRTRQRSPPGTTRRHHAVLMEHPPEPAAVVERRAMAELGVTIVRFANGVEGWFKPTDFKNDQVLFSLTASGGASLAPTADCIRRRHLPRRSSSCPASAGTAPSISRNCSPARSPRRARSYPRRRTGISGSSTPGEPRDRTAAAQSQISRPRADDPQAFALIRKQLEASYANRDNNPGLLFREKLSQVNIEQSLHLAAADARRGSQTLDRAAMARSTRSGSRTRPTSRSSWSARSRSTTRCRCVARYVGSLPSTGKAASASPTSGSSFPAASERVVVEKGREPRGTDGPELLCRSAD